MTSPRLLVLFLQLCSLQLMLVAMPTCLLNEPRTQKAHVLLGKMGPPFPVECLPYNANISFPVSAFPAATANHQQCRQVLGVVYEALNKTFNLFDDLNSPEEPPVSWDGAHLGNFMNLQFQLMGQYNNCCSFQLELMVFLLCVRAFSNNSWSSSCVLELSSFQSVLMVFLLCVRAFSLFSWSSSCVLELLLSGVASPGVLSSYFSNVAAVIQQVNSPW
ncbi:interferon alpha-G-like [Scomber scombrus]|uniref:Interferon alpha-G-like n=1 Tax=Scomber scombrus TaxID=13677 RepID=A0AAV1QET2_SCOSC